MRFLDRDDFPIPPADQVLPVDFAQLKVPARISGQWEQMRPTGTARVQEILDVLALSDNVRAEMAATIADAERKLAEEARRTDAHRERAAILEGRCAKLSARLLEYQKGPLIGTPPATTLRDDWGFPNRMADWQRNHG